VKAVVVLEDGARYYGRVFGAVKEEAFGEIVFNTSLSGYQEIITDPSYSGQIVVMTYPLIGNYGVNRADEESSGPKIRGFIVKELCDYPSNFRAEISLDEYFKKNNIMAIQGVDTRALTKYIRTKGAMKGAISTKVDDIDSVIDRVRASRGLIGVDLIREVTCGRPEKWNEEGDIRIAVLDCGVKYNILRNLADRGCQVTLYPANSRAEDILKDNPGGVLLSNGPGDPEAAPYIYETVRNLLGKVPVFGICLGHQMIGLAMGGKTFKLKFGHRGGNQPVMDIRTKKVSITSQNHGFCVDINSIKDKGTEITHINLNDKTIEGMENKELGFFCVQFHPEAGPGPNDAVYLFDQFVDSIKKWIKRDAKT
jgi:carbamoyl-phosphate synthase small subunit